MLEFSPRSCVNVTCEHNWASVIVARLDRTEVWFFNASHKCDALSWFFRHSSGCVLHNCVVPHLLYFIFPWKKGDSSLSLSADGAAPLCKSLYCHSPDGGNNPAATQAAVYFSFSSLQTRTDLFLLLEHNSTKQDFIYPWISSLWFWAQRNCRLQIQFKTETSNTQKTVSSLLCPPGCDLMVFLIKGHCSVEM